MQFLQIEVVRTDGSSLQWLRSQHNVKMLFKTVSTRWQVFPLHYDYKSRTVLYKGVKIQRAQAGVKAHSLNL